jgi:hypothetical protein
MSKLDTLQKLAAAAYEAYHEHDYRWATEAEQDRWMRVAARLETKYAKSIYVDLSDEDIEKAKAMRAEGMTFRTISRHFGCHPSTMAAKMKGIE